MSTVWSRLTGFLLSRHNLRRRIALAVGALTTAAVLLFGVVAWLVFALSLRTAIDDDLRTTVAFFDDVGPGALLADLQDSPTLEPTQPGGSRPPVPYIQVVAANGSTLGSPLPVGPDALAVAGGQRDEATETIQIDDRFVRVLTVPIEPAELLNPDGPQADGNPAFVPAAFRIGTDITNNVRGFRQARVGTVLAGLAAGLIASLSAWMGAGRLLAPVSAVAVAADRLRQNELPERLDGEGADELGRLVTSFNQLLDDLSRSRDQQRRLVADASHELRTPLTSLRVKIEFIQSQPGLDIAERQRLLDGAVADLGSLGELVSELVELAAEGANPERARLVELAEVVTAEVERFRATSGRTVDLHTAGGLVETRPKQVTRALANLLVNADKYSPADGVIVVHQNGSRIEVRDHGPGIPADERELVFNRFHRGKAHQSIEGSGLGLAIVEAAAKVNGGETWVSDPDDGGSGVVVGFSAGPSSG